jgi:putative ABC transport system permease protein
MMADLFNLSARSLIQRKLRSALTMLSIVIGVVLVISLVLLGDGLQNAIQGRLLAFGTDLLVVYPGKEESPLFGLLTDAQIRDRDVKVIEDVPGVRNVMPTQEKSFVHVSFRGEEESLRLHGQPIEAIKDVLVESSGFTLREGEWPSSEQAREVVMAATAADKSFDEPVRAGDTVEIKGRRFTVSGVLNPTGETNHDNAVFISLENARLISGRRSGVDFVTVKVNPDVEPEAVAEDIRRALAREPGAGDISVITAAKAGDVAGDIVGILQLVLSGIAAVALLVGGVGVMNTMYTSVLERTREIGVMKAVGASDRAVMTLFIIESGLLGLVGGAVGSAAGQAMAIFAEQVAQSQGFLLLDVQFDLLLFLMVLVGSATLGIVSGLMPAYRAAKLSPVQALRYE